MELACLLNNLNMNKYFLRMICFVLAIMFGIFMIVYGEMDDSPGGQGLGLLFVVVGVVGIKKNYKK